MTRRRRSKRARHLRQRSKTRTAAPLAALHSGAPGARLSCGACGRQVRQYETIRRGLVFFFQAEDGIRDVAVTGVQTCALPICKGFYDYSVDPPKLVALGI